MPGGRRSGWNQRLPAPLDVGRRRKLTTLAGVRSYVLSLPVERQSKQGWQIVTGALLKAAEDGSVASVDAAVRLAIMIDRGPPVPPKPHGKRG